MVLLSLVMTDLLLCSNIQTESIFRLFCKQLSLSYHSAESVLAYMTFTMWFPYGLAFFFCFCRFGAFWPDFTFIFLQFKTSQQLQKNLNLVKQNPKDGLQKWSDSRIRQNCNVYSGERQKPGNQNLHSTKTQGKRIVIVKVKTRYQNYVSIRQGLGRIRIKNKGRREQFLNRLAYK